MAVVTPVRSLLSLLDDMRSMIERIDDESYAAPAPGRSSGSIGGHVRHCLDHVSALVIAIRTGMCAYDRRMRGTAIESRRMAALNQILHFEGALAGVGNAMLDLPVDVETQIDTDGSMLVTTSTVGRELVFVTSHTIHHNAIISHLLTARGVDMGARFGLAPATPATEERMSCAQ
jgi:uncharacterized damage-inducible protein DinB